MGPGLAVSRLGNRALLHCNTLASAVSQPRWQQISLSRCASAPVNTPSKCTVVVHLSSFTFPVKCALPVAPSG